MAHGVVQEVPQDPTDVARRHQGRREIFERGGDLDTGHRRRWRDSREHGADELSDGHERLVDGLIAARQAAELEQVVDERAEPLRLVNDGPVIALDVFGVGDDAIIQCFGQRADGSDR